MALRAQTNIMAFNEKLNEFRASGRYCDVSIQVEDRSFRCHRLALSVASEYFDVMFNGHFHERRAETITLKDVDADTFKEVLRFVYTGDVVVNKENAFNLLRASEFFMLESVKEHCTRFIEENLPISEMFGALTYARLTEKTSLVELLSRYIVEHLDEYAEDDQFLELSFDVLSVLLSQRWYLSPKNEGALVSALIGWVDHERDSRTKYSEELIDKVQLRNMPEDYMKFVLKKVLLKSFAGQAPLPIEYDEAPMEPALGLHVYMDYSCDRKMRVYSTNKSYPSWNMTRTVNHYYTVADMACIGLDDYLYCLDRETFRACPSLDISPGCSDSRTLRYPPASLHIPVNDPYGICGIRNDIYIHGACDDDSGESPFSDEELAQGILRYNVDVDSWYAVPLLRKKFYNSTIVADDSVLYYVAGRMAGGTDASSEGGVCIQALDSRTSGWQDLTNNLTENSAVTLPVIYLCTLLERKIYVCVEDTDPGSNTLDKLISYDLTAKKWAKVKSLNEKNTFTCQLLTYENLLWAFCYSEIVEEYAVRAYNASTNQWSSPISKKLGAMGSRSVSPEEFMKAVVFKN